MDQYKIYAEEAVEIYKKLYKTMISEGILSLEDYFDEASGLTGFVYALFPFTEGIEGHVCMRIFDVLEENFEMDDYDLKKKWMFTRELAYDFFMNHQDKFDRAIPSYHLPTAEKEDSLEEIYEEIDEFAEVTFRKYFG